MHSSTLLSPAEAAKILLVHQSTIKRWVDDGTIPASRTSGGHRRILLADLLRLVRDKKLPSVQLNPDMLGPWIDGTVIAAEPVELIRSKMESALKSNQHVLVSQILIHCLEGGMTIEQLGDSLIFPLMCELGHSWVSGETEVAEEHLVTSHLQAALVSIRNRLLPVDASSRPLAVGACPEADFHVLGNQLVELVLLQNGWQVVNIGGNTPLPSLGKMLEKLRPTLAWVTCTTIADVEKFVVEEHALYELASRLNIELYLGGQALVPEVRRRLHYHWIGDTISQFSFAARRLHPGPGFGG